MTAKLCIVAAKAWAATERYACAMASALVEDRSGAVRVDDALVAVGLQSAGPA